jgi:hypothetical protein
MKVPSDGEISAGLDFILGHFAALAFPRMISTNTTEGRQVCVNNRAEALARFKQANYMDCRINAYSKHDIRGNPNFIFIDIDCTDKALLDTILTGKIQCIEAHPTVLFTGSGYHIYQPIECGVKSIDELGTFSNYNEPSKRFLKFAEIYLSNNKCDHNHNPSFKSSMVRIPNSINSKNGMQVKIVQSWDGERPDIRLLLGSFYAWILTEEQKQQKKAAKFDIKPNSNLRKSEIKWIENNLLKTALGDYRKTITNQVLAPYLVNIRQMSFEQATKIIQQWLNICGIHRELDFNPKRLVNAALIAARKSGYKPMSLDTLKQRNIAIYETITDVKV